MLYRQQVVSSVSEQVSHHAIYFVLFYGINKYVDN